MLRIVVVHRHGNTYMGGGGARPLRHHGVVLKANVPGIRQESPSFSTTIIFATHALLLLLKWRTHLLKGNGFITSRVWEPPVAVTAAESSPP